MLPYNNQSFTVGAWPVAFALAAPVSWPTAEASKTLSNACSTPPLPSPSYSRHQSTRPSVIRLNMPPVTEDRRKDLAKEAKALGEEGKVGRLPCRPRFFFELSGGCTCSSTATVGGHDALRVRRKLMPVAPSPRFYARLVMPRVGSFACLFGVYCYVGVASQNILLGGMRACRLILLHVGIAVVLYLGVWYVWYGLDDCRGYCLSCMRRCRADGRY